MAGGGLVTLATLKVGDSALLGVSSFFVGGGTSILIVGGVLSGIGLMLCFMGGPGGGGGAPMGGRSGDSAYRET